MKAIIIIIGVLFSAGAMAEMKIMCTVHLSSECLEIVDSRVSSSLSKANTAWQNIEVEVKCKVALRPSEIGYKKYLFVDREKTDKPLSDLVVEVNFIQWEGVVDGGITMTCR